MSVLIKFMFHIVIFMGVLISTAPVEAKQIQILALGDSYTIGYGVSENNRWPIQLKKLLQEKGLSVDPVKIIARSGWTTQDLLSALKGQDVQDSYDLVTLLIGVNDQYQRRPIKSFHQDFINLLKEAISYADGDPTKVIVVSLPDWGVSPFGRQMNQQAIAEDINRFNRLAESTASQFGANWVNITESSRQTIDQAMFVTDGLHPSSQVYKIWSEIIFPEAYTIINNK